MAEEMNALDSGSAAKHEQFIEMQRKVELARRLAVQFREQSEMLR